MNNNIVQLIIFQISIDYRLSIILQLQLGELIKTHPPYLFKKKPLGTLNDSVKLV